jgi:hypothetical protein
MADLNLPPNIREFNEITGVIFAQLYAVFPVLLDIDADAVAKTPGHSLSDKLESGRTFGEILSYTAGWLALEGFTHASGAHARSRVCLTTKALAAMNAVPEKLQQPLGSQLAEAAKQGSSDAGKLKLAELVGTLLGSFTGSVTKSVGGGRGPAS